MKKIFLTIACFCLSYILPAQTFQYAIGGLGADAGKSIVKTSDGGYAIGGSFGYDSSDVYVVKLNSSGIKQWSRRIGGNSYDGGTCIIQTADGGYALTGRTGYWTFEMYVVKLDSSGNLQWTRKLSNGLFDQGYSIIQTNEGGYAISGRTYDQNFSSYTAWLVKLNNAGNVVWANSVSGFLDGAYSTVQTSDKGYVLSGATNIYGAGFIDLYFVKLDSMGSIQWTRTVGGTSDEHVIPGSKIIKTNDGGFAQAAFTNSFGPGGNDVYVVKLGSTGNLQWTRVVGGTGDDIGHAIAQTSDKGFVIAGSTTSYGAGNADAYIIRLDSNGVLLWTRTTGGSGEDAGYDIVQTNGGGYMMTGSTTSFGNGNGDVYVVKIDATGYTCGNKSSGGLTTTGGVAGIGGGWASLTNYTTGTGGNLGYEGIQVSICNCITTASITPQGPLNFCSGGSVLLQANTGTGYTYQWKKNGVAISGATLSSYSASTSGTYKVSVTDIVNGCSSVTSSGKVVTVKSAPTASVTPQGPTTFCSGDSVQLKANYNANYAYQWKKNNVNISGATSNKYEAKTAGNYKVKVTGANGCTVLSSTITVSVPCRDGGLLINDPALIEINVFPNPSKGIIYINNSSLNEKIIFAQFSDVMGKILGIKNIEGVSDQINCSDFPNGIYILSLYSDLGNVVKKKIIILK